MTPGIPRLLVALLLVIYPLLVWQGLDRLGVAPMVVVLGGLLIARSLMLGERLGRLLPLAMVAIVLFVVAVVLSGDSRGLLLYPVLVNAALCGACAWSLMRPPSLLERGLRLAGRELPDEATPYLRVVTACWAVFFAANGAVAAWTALAASLDTWAFYNGFLAYVLIGAMIGIECLVRPVYRRRVARGRND
ncbi:hypothetical protein F3N42_08745 [Marinihelvus fidelis]|uniref:DNA gyrase subunit B n=1 Tax=Marinihelvus fidelis TaxID=2613842 RepID=A0A5N0TDM9_9GAMM|nr:hypothetical protein [Marinihelvus fidelis]KAA9131399.1 hypothetical protein F3N42_08745 [Marinihelvus fidelis]